jgi:type II secretory ATPase GspE/PulE/Tfp pilus assembly ATPase PilB-like protein
VQSALTGHLVLSTVHTNSAAATMTRLRDMGLEDCLMTATLKAVLAQRLVRRLCAECKAVETAPDALIDPEHDLSPCSEGIVATRKSISWPRTVSLIRPSCGSPSAQQCRGAP